MKRVLLTPLDWGLGHATRCIPVIRELQSRGWKVLLAGSGDSLELLRIEFPMLASFSLPGYAPRYPLAGSMAVKMAQQLPRFLHVISEEHKAVKKIISEAKIDLIISDNRYGCWSREIPSVFITHQSNIIMPKRFGIFQSLVRRLNEHFMKRFQVCWIPDRPGEDSLAGDLGDFKHLSPSVKFQHIGWLSRFRKNDRDDARFTFDVLAIFSGPEPQRTAFENVVVPQLEQSGLNYRVVRGLPRCKDQEDSRTFNFLASKELQNMIESSAIIIARSGYSTVMDMHALEKKVIFVPTPGQTEQEYLARLLRAKGVALCSSQAAFDLSKALRDSQNFSGFNSARSNGFLAQAIGSLENL